MSDNKRVVGEDKLSRLVRLIQLLEDELKTTGSVEVTLTSAGSGDIDIEGETLFNFDSVERLMLFLEGGQLKRMLMVRG